jgi:hypothetical protein
LLLCAAEMAFEQMIHDPPVATSARGEMAQAWEAQL